MASIVRRKDSFCVVYSVVDEDNKRKQKWETFKSMPEAKKRKAEIEFKTSNGIIHIPKCKTLNQLLNEYIELYGKTKWALSTYSNNCQLIDHYIRPFLGKMELDELSPRILERYYQELQKTKVAQSNSLRSRDKLVTAHTVIEVHKLLRSCFNQAVKWELMEKNPAALATTPKAVSKKREIWTSDTLFHAIDVCDDPRLALALNLAFCCSLRMGEMLALTWDCVDVSNDSINHNGAFLRVTKELQRVNRGALNELDQKDVELVFPAYSRTSNTVLVLKKPKTDSSIRKVFIPKTVAKMLATWKGFQEKRKLMLGDEYRDFNLVFASDMGYPVEGGAINKSLQRLIRQYNLPPVVFHSFRHASVTYKLKLNGGDIKAVQGDTGHAQSKMVTETYSHILEEDRQRNAQLFEKAFYENDQPFESNALPASELPEGISPETLAKLLTNPEVVTLLGALAKTMK